MNKKKFIKKSSIFLGIATAIVTIPTVTSTVTATKTNTEQKTNSSLGNNVPDINNYKNGGTKNNETMNFDDILNGANKASISDPVYAFNENNQLVVPNINETYYKDLQSNDSYVSNTLKGNYMSNVVTSIPNNNAQIDIEAIKNAFNDGKQKSLENSLSKFTDEQLNSVVTLTDSQKKWINYLIPNNNINLDNDFVLKDFITQLTDNSYTEAQNGNLSSANIVNSLSAFGINLDEEKAKLSNVDSLTSLSDILNNNGSFNNVLYGGGGVSSPKSPDISNNPNVVTPPTGESSDEIANTVTAVELNGYLVSVMTLTSITIAISAAQIAIDIVLFLLTFGNWYYIVDSVAVAVGVVFAGISLDDYINDINILNLNALETYFLNHKVLNGISTKFKELVDNDNIYKTIANVDEDENSIKKITEYIQKLREWKNTQKVSKFVDGIKYIKYLKLSLVGVILEVVNTTIDITVTFLDTYFEGL